MEIKDKKDFALQILDALSVKEDDDLGYLISLNNHYLYHHLTDKNIDTLINDILSDCHINWFDENKLSGSIEINGNQLSFNVV